MELVDYARVIRRRWKVVAACVLALLAATIAVTFSVTPQYSSSARLFVSTAPRDAGQAYEGSLFSEQRVLSYANLAKGAELSRRVVDRLDLEVAPRDLAERITTEVIPETVVLQVSVEDPSPERARRLTETVAEELTAFVAELETPTGDRTSPIRATIIDRPALPQNPVSPQPLRNMGIAVVGGLIIGMALALWREVLDTSVKTPDDAIEASGVPVIGRVVYDPAARARPLITDLDTSAPRCEAIRILRTNLQFVDVDRPSKLFVVTSPMAREGKTTTAANLAISLGQAGHRVLLVDADLRRPEIDAILGLVPDFGLTTVLAGQCGLEQAVESYPGIPQLSVLTSGPMPPNPSELLQSEAMAHLLQQAREAYEVVVIDSPPLLPVADAALLTAQADGALVVVRQGRTTKDQVRESMKRLEAVGGRTFGIVLNMVDQPSEYVRGYDESDRHDRRGGQGAVRSDPTVASGRTDARARQDAGMAPVVAVNLRRRKGLSET